MSKKDNNATVTEVKEEKVVTKYDKKMQRRREEARKDARNRKIFKITSITVLLVAAIVLVTAIVLNVNKIYREYIKVNDESVSQIEFDMYYSLTKSGIVSQTLYGDVTYLDYFTSYLGYSADKSDKVQDYTEEYTWFDYFATATLNTIKEYKALNKIADEKEFDYKDADSDYNEFIDEMKKSADEAGVSMGQYYKDVFGKHATKSNIEKYLKEYLRATAFEESYYESEKASDEEVKKYYEEHKDDYDTVEYHSVYIRAEEKNDTALAEAKKKAEEFMNDVVSEKTFVEMCVDYVAKDDVETYKKENATLMTNISKNTISTKEADWLFNKDRKEGDKAVLEDETNYQYQVVYFLKREYDLDNNESIRATLYAEEYQKLIESYTKDMSVDVMKRISVME